MFMLVVKENAIRSFAVSLSILILRSKAHLRWFQSTSCTARAGLSARLHTPLCVGVRLFGSAAKCNGVLA
jgi:hypothetical protein